MTKPDLPKSPNRPDGAALAASAAALMTLPQNAANLVRLQRLAALGSSVREAHEGSVSARTLTQILQEPEFSDPRILGMEDPFEDIFVQSIAFTGGPYLASPGMGLYSTANVKSLLQVIAATQDFSNEDRQWAYAYTRAILQLSDHIWRKVGLRRGTLPQSRPGDKIHIPSDAELTRLRQAVTFTTAELGGISPSLSAFVDAHSHNPGDLTRPCKEDITDDRLILSPFLKTSQGYVVVLPTELCTTLRYYLMGIIAKNSGIPSLAANFARVAAGQISDEFSVDLKFRRAGGSNTTPNWTATTADGLKINLVSATDRLEGWNQTEVWPQISTDQQIREVTEILAAEDATAEAAGTKLLHMIAIDSPGREGFWGIPTGSTSNPVLLGRSEDLALIIRHQERNPNALYLFGQALQRRSYSTLSAGILDDYSIYTENQNSFYLSDDGVPTFAVTPPGAALAIRAADFESHDLHVVHTTTQPRMLTWVSRALPYDAPEIYRTDPRSSCFGYTVEDGDTCIFITLHESVTPDTWLQLELLQTTSYWISQVTQSLGDLFYDLPCIEIEIEDAIIWLDPHLPVTSDPPVRVRSTSRGKSICFTRTFAHMLRSRDNAAERELVDCLLGSVFGLKASDRVQALDRIAPTGSKRMMHTFADQDALELNPGLLPEPVYIHEQAEALVLDELGQWLTSPSGAAMSAGKVQSEERGAVLNAAVEHLFAKLEHEISRFDTKDLLGALIRGNESLIRRSKIDSLLLPSRLACFGANSRAATRLVEDRSNSSTAQRATRFVIEYVAATQPHGNERSDGLSYMRILSIASEICNRGATSDLIHYGLADYSVEILNSGRLGVSREDPMNRAISDHSHAIGDRLIRSALGEPIPKVDSSIDVEVFLEENEEAFRAEFGFSMPELAVVCGELLSKAAPDQMNTCEVDEFIHSVINETGLKADIVRNVIAHLSLESRDSFMSIGSDAFPWRFNRDASYVRRPLVRVGNEIFYGYRSILGVGPYWLDGVLSARLQAKAKTKQMKACISNVRTQINADFAHAVAKEARAQGAEVKESVKKLNGQRIVGPTNQDLGDVDILAWDERAHVAYAIEAKDFELARTPNELSMEMQKIFSGKKGKKTTEQLHYERVEWLKTHSEDIRTAFGCDCTRLDVRVVGAIVTSETLVTPFMAHSRYPVIALADLSLDLLIPPARAVRNPRAARRVSRSQRKRRK
ncbi:hypothetical protein GCM10027030_07900 [Luteococcus sediminum]